MSTVSGTTVHRTNEIHRKHRQRLTRARRLYARLARPRYFLAPLSKREAVMHAIGERAVDGGLYVCGTSRGSAIRLARLSIVTIWRSMDRDEYSNRRDGRWGW